MLTLNTGQTPMSVRHQIEIMYQDYLSVPVEGISLVTEAQSRRARQPNCYNFKDVIEGLNSYLERSESPLDRGDILDNIASLENLAKENGNQDVFKNFLSSWNAFIQKVTEFDLTYPSTDIDEGGDDDEDEKAWGRTGVQIFKRSQAISGFGAAIGLLRDDDSTVSFESLDIQGISIGAPPDDFMNDFNDYIEDINKRSKRIGNAQRLFFRQYFLFLN
jgi:hypothetical protein